MNLVDFVLLLVALIIMIIAAIRPAEARVSLIAASLCFWLGDLVYHALPK